MPLRGPLSFAKPLSRGTGRFREIAQLGLGLHDPDLGDIALRVPDGLLVEVLEDLYDVVAEPLSEPAAAFSNLVNDGEPAAASPIGIDENCLSRPGGLLGRTAPGVEQPGENRESP